VKKRVAISYDTEDLQPVKLRCSRCDTPVGYLHGGCSLDRSQWRPTIHSDFKVWCAACSKFGMRCVEAQLPVRDYTIDYVEEQS
jgi:hypothetical protein